MPRGFDKLEMLRAGGFTEEQVGQFAEKQKAILKKADFQDKEIKDYFGEKEFKTERVKEIIRKNMERQGMIPPEGNPEGEPEQAASDQVGEPGQLYASDSKEVTNILEAFEAGFDTSVTGLQMDRPDRILQENAVWYHRIASQVGTLTGDLPYMLTGSAAGGVAGATAGATIAGAAGTVAGGPLGTVAGIGVGAAGGAAIGAGAGAFALPEALRQAYIDSYEEGEIKDFEDFWTRVSSTLIAGAKGGVIGGATFGTGKVIGGLAKGAGPVAKTAAETSSEILTMVGVGSAIEGEMPKFHHFTDAAIVIGGLKGAGFGLRKTTHYVPQKLRYIYRNTGKKPQEIAEAARLDPKVRQEMLSKNNVPFRDEVLLNEPPPQVPSNVRALPEVILEKSPTAKTPVEVSPTSAAVAKVRESIGEQPSRLKTKMSYAKFYKDFVDKLDPVNRATKLIQGKTGETLPAEQNPYILSRMVVDYKAKAKHAFEKGTLDYQTRNTNGKSLREILEPIGNLDEFVGYLMSKRALEKSGQGKRTGIDTQAAGTVVKNLKGKYEKSAKEFTEFNNRVLEYVRDSGLISKEDFIAMKEANKDYVSFKRIIEAGDDVASGKGKAGSLKKFFGSERKIQDPIESTLENVQELYRISEVNRARRSLVEIAESLEGQELITRVSRKQKIKITAEEARKAFPKEVPDFIEAVMGAEGNDVQIFRARRDPLRKNEFEVFRNGKREVYETTPELAEALTGLGGDTTSSFMAMRLMNKITTLKKLGITFTPDFILRNFGRDYVTGTVFSKAKINPQDVFGAVGSLIKKDNTYYEWLKSGGANGAFLELGQRYMQKDIVNLQRQTSFMGSAKNVIQKPLDMMRVGAELAEQSLRLAEFKKVSEATGSKVQGGFASREITLDFQRVGAKVSALNSITAFLNVSIQGLDKTGRAFIEKPGETSLRAAAAITAPSVLLWWANKDDIRYQEAPQWEKDLFWIIPTDSWEEATPGEAQGLNEQLVRKENGKIYINKGTMYRIPKPMELGVIFGTLPERTMEAFFRDNPDAFDEFEKTVSGMIVPSFTPDAIAPIAEQYMNKSFFTGNDLIPYYMEKNSGPLQYRDYTSDTAKTLGKLMAPLVGNESNGLSSPIILDNYLRSWGGTLGQYAIDVTDEALQKAGVTPDPSDPEMKLADTPFLRAFTVRFPRSTSNSVEKFYKNLEEFETVQADVNKLKNEGNLEALQSMLALEENRIRMMDLSSFRKALSNQRKFVSNVRKDPNMTSEDKSQLIDQAYLTMMETARQANKLIEQVTKRAELDKFKKE